MNHDPAGPASPDRGHPGQPAGVQRRDQVEGEIRGYLAALSETAFRPGTAGTAGTVSGAVDPLDVVRAATLVRRIATTYARAAASEARGAGRSWDEVADALVAPGPPGNARVRAAQAFEQVADVNPYPLPPSARWTCSACAAPVDDYGPEYPAAGREAGHARGCVRQATARHAGRHATPDPDPDTGSDPGAGGEGGSGSDAPGEGDPW